MKHSSVVARPDAFTLIELLTVIAIISILMALLFPMVIEARENTRRTKAKQECLSIVHGVENFHVDYGQYPKLDPSATTPDSAPDESAGDAAAEMTHRNSALFNTLRDIDRPPNANRAQNPKRQIYFSANPVNNSAKPKDGFLETSGSPGGSQGSLYDAWGSEYNIVLDANSDNVIDTKYEDFMAENAPRVSVGAFTLGKDKLLGKNGNRRLREGTDQSDDRVSWAGH